MKIGLSPLQAQASFDETLRECERAEAAGADPCEDGREVLGADVLG